MPANGSRGARLRHRLAAMLAAVPLALGISMTVPAQASGLVHPSPAPGVVRVLATGTASDAPAEREPATTKPVQDTAKHDFWSAGMQRLAILVAVPLALSAYLTFRRQRTQRHKGSK